MRFLFVCTGNTCRSPMAERLARLHYPQHEWHSAGVMPTYDIQPMTVTVIEEAGGDASGFEGTDIRDLKLDTFDHVLLIGETARNYTGRVPAGVKTQVWYIFDPYHAVGTDEEKLDIYREVRDEILSHVHELAVESGIEAQSAG